jgi:hypothetical protein
MDNDENQGRSRHILAAVLIFALGVGGIVAFRFLNRVVPETTGPSNPATVLPPVTVQGYYGGEKEVFLKDPDVQRILRDKYGITIVAKKAGSIEMVRDLSLSDQTDFLWPSSQVALALYKQNGGKSTGSDNIFNSPIVIYSWAEVTDALIEQKIVAKRGESYYIVDFSRLCQLIADGKRWSEIGLPQLNGKIAIRTTDPTKSNSGNMFAGLLANVLNKGEVADNAAMDKLLPELKAIFERLGFKESSSSDLFQQYLTTGVGAKPMIAGYESQLIEFSLQNEAYRKQLKDRLRVLYPEPTVWSSHPLIARSKNGLRLLDAFKDPEIQDIAWRRHGFRSGLVGVTNSTGVLQTVGVPETISAVIDMPTPEVMDRIIAALESSASHH